jgi:SAM-dependent methyltransferase
VSTFRDDDQRTIRYFTDRVQRYGETVDALDWGSRASQLKRFEVLAAIGIRTGDRVLDVGCGQGDFYDWLRDNRIDPVYVGADLTPAMIDTARRRFPGVRFEVRAAGDTLDLGGQDYIVASGIFYLRRHDPFDYLCSVVRSLYSQCRRGLAFNCLAATGDAGEGGEYREAPERVLEFCRSLAPGAELRRDYHPADFTVYLRKGHASA